MSNISVTLGSIFTADFKKIFIPPFQRPYSWGKSEITDYLSDLEKVFDNDDYDHFFGLLVFVQKVSPNGQFLKGQKDVIDGQQRLTTTMITLSIIRDLIEDYLENYGQGGLISRGVKQDFIDAAASIRGVLQINKEFRLVSENESLYENEFLEFIQKPAYAYPNGSLALKLYDDQEDGEKNSFECKEQHLLNYKKNKNKTRFKTSYRNYKLVHEFFEKKLQKLSPVKKLSYLERATHSILSQFRVIIFTVDSYDMAFEYFEVLNDRGLDVSALDLIKNNCLKTPGLNNHQRQEIFKVWKEIFSNKLDHTYNSLQFVRYAYMSQHGHITSKEIYSKYQRMLARYSTFSEMKSFLEDNLSVSAVSFKNIKTPESGSFSKDSRIYNGIRLLNSTKTVQWQSIILRVLDYYLPNQQSVTSKTSDTILILIEELFNISFTINLVDKVANVLEKRFPEIAMSIDIKGPVEFENTLIEATRAVKNLSIKEDLRISLIDNRTILDHNTFQDKNDLATMVIFAIQYKEESKKGNYLVTTSLEHTLPQTIDSNKWPAIAKMSLEEQEKAIYSIGNMMLTHSSNNSKIGNKTFFEKKTLYKSRKIYDPLADNAGLFYQNVNEWTHQIIDLRSKSLATKLKQLYP